ncbi:MAG: hypothetical protein ACK4SF_04530 [Algoriphagus aquaeductus]|uniref:hypothetical protein n=1 Tax=Algoriphagus aquaeductus TaxID=475299 RepID=UPI00391B3C94
MPKINKSFHLEITVEQFLNACSLLELQEVELLLDSHIRRAEERELRKNYSQLKNKGLNQIERTITDINQKNHD